MPNVRTIKKAAVAPTETPRTEAPRIDHAQAEHIFIASDEAPDPRSAAHTVRHRWRLANPLRRELTNVTLFEEGYLEVVEHARGRKGESFRLDLHYLDPIPAISRVIAKRAWWTTAGCTAAALAAFALSSLGPLAVSCALGAGAVALGAAAFALHRSHEKIEFFTLHGRARVLTLAANFGAIKPLRAFVPELSRAIEEAAEKISGDTSAFLRQEMREHYRLRGDGVLSNEICTESTGRILAQFDVQI
jgi:hypothetical protein